MLYECSQLVLRVLYCFCYCYCLVTVATYSHTAHILSSIELKALAKLLQAFQEDKIRELRQSIDKNETKNVSLEEVESLLRQNGKPEVASRLKEDLIKGNNYYYHNYYVYTIINLTVVHVSILASGSSQLPEVIQL